MPPPVPPPRPPPVPLVPHTRVHTRASNPRLGYNDISADGASALAALLHAGSSALETLELQGNHVGDAGAIALANSLAGRGAWGGKRGDRRDVKRPRSGGLRSLNLAGNGIGWAGGVALAEALAGGGARGRGGRGRGGGGEVTLEELELAGNPVSVVRSGMSSFFRAAIIEDRHFCLQ